jgi:hypothetical protein
MDERLKHGPDRVCAAAFAATPVRPLSFARQSGVNFVEDRLDEAATAERMRAAFDG